MTSDLFLGTNYGTYYGNGVEGAYGRGNGGGSNGRRRQTTYSTVTNFSRNNAANYSEDFNYINRYFANGEIDKGLEELWALENEYKATLEETTNYAVSDRNVRSMVSNGFLNATGRSLTQAANLDSEFTNEFKKALGFGIGGFFTPDYSEEEFLAMQTDGNKDNISDKAKIKGNIGAALGGATTGAVLGGAGLLLASTTFSLPILAGAAVAGGAIALAKKLFLD